MHADQRSCSRKTVHEPGFGRSFTCPVIIMHKVCPRDCSLEVEENDWLRSMLCVLGTDARRTDTDGKGHAGVADSKYASVAALYINSMDGKKESKVSDTYNHSGQWSVVRKEQNPTSRPSPTLLRLQRAKEVL